MNYKHEDMINEFNEIIGRADDITCKAIAALFDNRCKTSYGFIQYLISAEFGITSFLSERSLSGEVKKALAPTCQMFLPFSKKYRKYSSSWGREADTIFEFDGNKLVVREGAVPIFKDEYYKKENRKINGVYLIGQTTFNPYTDEKFYWLKFGGTSNAQARMRTYDTDNPSYFKIDFKDCGTNSYAPTEIYYRGQLAKLAICSSDRNSEWFLVDRSTYLAICESGFKFFDEAIN